MVAGDANTGAIDAVGAGASQSQPGLNINLLDFQTARPKANPNNPNGQIILADATVPVTQGPQAGQITQSCEGARGPDGRLLGPAPSNIYKTPCAGVVPIFHPNPPVFYNTPPTSDVSDSPPLTVAPSVQTAIDTNQQQTQAVIQSVDPTGDASTGNGATLGSNLPSGVVDGASQLRADVKMGSFGAAAVALAYTKWFHPRLENSMIPGQLEADGMAEAGTQTKLSKVGRALFPKPYLENFSTKYAIQSELEIVKTQEDMARQHLKDLLNKADSELRTNPNDVKHDEIQKFLNADENKPFLDARERNLPWNELHGRMAEQNFFDDDDRKPIKALADKYEPYYKKLGVFGYRKDLSVTDLKSLDPAALVETSTGWRAKFKFLKEFSSTGAKFVTGAAALYGLDYVQNNLIVTGFRNNDDPKLARIAQTNFPGECAKMAGLFLGRNTGTKVGGFLFGQLYESENNMTQGERLGTTAGVTVAGGLAALKEGKLGLALAVGGLAVGAISEITHASLFQNDSIRPDLTAALTSISTSGTDVSQSTLNALVNNVKKQGERDPLLMTDTYATTLPLVTVRPTDSPAFVFSKSKQQLVLDQAQGEIILENGLTSSQYQNMAHDIGTADNPNHHEAWRLAPTDHLDIGAQGTRTLIRAMGAANDLEVSIAQGAVSPGGPDQIAANIAQIEQQKAIIKKELDQQLHASHAAQINDALLNNDTYGFFTHNRWISNNDYNLVEGANGAVDYRPVEDEILLLAQKAQTISQADQALLQAAQTSLQSAQANPSDAQNILVQQEKVQMFSDGVNLTTAYTAKLYRDEALMELGQVQADVERANQNKNTNKVDDLTRLKLAVGALQNAAKIDNSNPDIATLKNIIVGLQNSVQQMPDASF
jgi:hypothetical protein